MKIRNGFVSNSSSSSYIVIDLDPENIDSLINHQASLFKSEESVLKYELITKEPGILYLGSELGEFQFGWEVVRHFDIGSKINFAYLIAYYIKKENIKMLCDVILKYTNINEIFDGDIDKGYIDHQSIEKENMSMYDSEFALISFLFNHNSYIQGDNDNY